MWDALFDLQIGAGEKIVRTVLIYVFLVVALRIFGKRELGQANTLDLLVLLLVANAVQNGIIGDDLSVTGALLGASVVFGVNALLNRGTFAFPWLARALEGTPTLLVSDGELQRAALGRSAITIAQLEAIARRQGLAGLNEVGAAVLEVNGSISVFKRGEPGPAL